MVLLIPHWRRIDDLAIRLDPTVCERDRHVRRHRIAFNILTALYAENGHCRIAPALFVLRHDAFGHLDRMRHIKRRTAFDLYGCGSRTAATVRPTPMFIAGLVGRVVEG